MTTATATSSVAATVMVKWLSVLLVSTVVVVMVDSLWLAVFVRSKRRALVTWTSGALGRITLLLCFPLTIMMRSQNDFEMSSSLV